MGLVDEKFVHAVEQRELAERDRANAILKQLTQETERRIEAEAVIRRMLRVRELRGAEAVADADAGMYAARWGIR